MIYGHSHWKFNRHPPSEICCPQCPRQDSNLHRTVSKTVASAELGYEGFFQNPTHPPSLRCGGVR